MRCISKMETVKKYKNYSKAQKYAQHFHSNVAQLFFIVSSLKKYACYSSCSAYLSLYLIL